MPRRAKTVLTDTAIRGLKPKATLYKKADGHTPRLLVCIAPSGKKSFEFWYTSPELHRDRPYPLGDYPAVSLVEARKKAANVKKLIGKGIDPREDETREEARRMAEQEGTLRTLLNLYLERLRKEGKDRYADRVEQDIKLNIPVEALQRPADAIAEADIIGWMHTITDRARERGRTGERSADYLKTYINAAYEFVLSAGGTKWAAKAKPFAHLTINPALRIKKFQTTAGIGQRTLSSSEFVRLWQSVGIEAMTPDLALYIKLAFHLAGQRVEELLWAPWSEFDIEGKVWAIPITRRKIRSKAAHQEPHLVFITKTAAGLLEELQEHTGDTEWLFPGRTGENPGESPRTTPALNQAIRRYCRPGPQSKRESFELFTPRDIRRSVKTLMGEAGISKEVRDRIQGHAFSDVGSKHYDRYDYWKEKQAAMLKWERWLNNLAKPGRATVVQLREARP